MSKTLENVQALIRKLEVRISDHGYNERSSDNLFAWDIVEGAIEAIVVEDYPKGLACWWSEGYGKLANTCGVGNS